MPKAWELEGQGRGVPLVVIFGSPDEWRSILRLVEGRMESPDSSEFQFGRLYLVDTARTGYYEGILGLGDSIDSTVVRLRSMIDEIEPDRLITLGRGLGGHAALVYGIALNAERIVAIQPYACLIEDDLEGYHDFRLGRELDGKPDPAEARRFEALAMLERVPFDGRVSIMIGTGRTNPHPDAVHLNAIHAHWLGRSPRVTIHPLPVVADITPDWLVGQPDAQAVLSRLLFGDSRDAEEPGRRPVVQKSESMGGPRMYYHPKLTICKLGADDPMNKGGREVSYAAVGEVDSTETRKFTDELRRWVVENLLLDGSPDDLANSLLPLGISRRETLREVDQARFHPYFLGSNRLLGRLKKLDWLLESYDKLDRLRRDSSRIDCRDRIPRHEFLKDYFSTGRPLIVTGGEENRSRAESWKSHELLRGFGGGEGGSPTARTSMGPEGRPPGTREQPSIPFELRDESDNLWSINRPNQLSDQSFQAQQFFDRTWGELEHLHELVGGRVTPIGSPWFGLPGTKLSNSSGRKGLFVLQLVGRSRWNVVTLINLRLRQQIFDPLQSTDERASSPGRRKPMDQIKILSVLLEPGELFFLPAECWFDGECLEPNKQMQFDV